MKNHFELVDFLKGYAIFTIVLFHLLLGQVTGVLGTAINFGGAGVHIFVLCSGFGLYLKKRRTGYFPWVRVERNSNILVCYLEQKYYLCTRTTINP